MAIYNSDNPYFATHTYDKVRDSWWVSKDGTSQPIKQMGDGHLIATINMLGRDPAMMNAKERHWPHLIEEANRRGIQVLPATSMDGVPRYIASKPAQPAVPMPAMGLGTSPVWPGTTSATPSPPTPALDALIKEITKTNEQVAPSVGGYSSIPKQTKVWIDALGNQHRICDMDEKYLAGTLRILKRAAVMARALRLVAEMDDPTSSFEQIQKTATTEWIKFVPMPDMFESMEKDWVRRNGTKTWEDAMISTEGQIASDVRKVIEKLAGPIKEAEPVGRAVRTIEI